MKKNSFWIMVFILSLPFCIIDVFAYTSRYIIGHIQSITNSSTYSTTNCTANVPTPSASVSHKIFGKVWAEIEPGVEVSVWLGSDWSVYGAKVYYIGGHSYDRSCPLDMSEYRLND